MKKKEKQDKLDIIKLKDEIKKFISYFIVGGCAAIVEWVTFFISNKFFNFNISTIIAFLIATTFNYYFAKAFTFKNDKHKKSDIIAVFIVSAIGLALNILFMNILIKIIHLKNEMLAKIISTGLVFIWNYVSRRIFIYKGK